jgi:hypothetical protein
MAPPSNSNVKKFPRSGRAEIVPKSEVMRVISPSLDREALVEWMMEVTDPKMKKWQGCLFQLCQKHPEHGLDMVSSKSVPRGLDEEERRARVELVAAQLEKAANGWAEESPTATVFVVGVSVTESPDPEEAQPEFDRFPFRVAPSQRAADLLSGEFGEPLNRSGADPQLFGHMSRLIDNLVTVAVKSAHQGQDRLVEILDKTNEINERVMSERFKMYELHEQLADDRMTREARAREKNQELDTQRKIVNMLFQYVPPIAMEIARSKGYLPAGTEVESPVMSVLKGLDPDQLFTIFDALRPEQRGQLAPMLETVSSGYDEAGKKRFFQLMQEGMLRKQALAEQAAARTCEPAGGEREEKGE